MSAAKDALRANARARRAEAHARVDPAPALTRLREMLDETEGAVGFYWPIRTEMDPRPVMEAMATRRPVCLPVTHGRDAPLTFRRWSPGMTMETDGFGIAVPVVEDRITPGVLVVPLLAFDRACHRLGYGAGHYDRTLDTLRATAPVVTVGLAYAAQEADAPLPVEPTDQALGAIVTETDTILPGTAPRARADP